MRTVRKAVGWVVLRALGLLLECLAVPVLVAIALSGRWRRKSIDVGLGPEPMINNVYHKKALEHCGYRAETFVMEISFITDEFDVRADLMFGDAGRFFHARRVLASVYLFAVAARRYRCVYIYFNGGPVGLGTRLLGPLEPHLFKLARVKVVAMPYGGDVQDLSLATNLAFKDAMAKDYPRYRLRQAATFKRIQRWTRHADHVISGCDWVDYMYHWDTLMLGHFSIDADRWTSEPREDDGILRVLHAPNHRRVKGSQHFIKAVSELADEGVAVELVIVERVPNSEIRRQIESVDVVADQLVIGWYAMFALEAMAMGKAVLCYLRPDLLALYEDAELVERGEIPIINCTPATVKEVLRNLANDKEAVLEAQRRGPEFVRCHHSIESVGAVFDSVNRACGVLPQGHQ